MKILKYFNVIIPGILLCTACDCNKLPEFNDADAYVAFDKSTMTVKEENNTLKVPVTLVSLKGKTETIAYVVTDGEGGSGAKAGMNYQVLGSGTLSFTPENSTQYIEFQINDVDGYTGDLFFNIELTNAGSINLGAGKTCKVTILDKDHPLSSILGTYTADADSYFSNRGHFNWEITIDKDADDVTKVWIGNLEPYFAENGYTAPNANYFYGIVNADKTEIRVPVGQKVGYKEVILAGFDGADPDESEQLASGNIIIEIQENGKKLKITNAFGAVDDGWWNLFYGNLMMIKK